MTGHTNETDEEIALRVQGGDTEAFGLLVERYEAKLIRYGGKFLPDRADIDDLVQDIFIRAYENIQSFDATLRFSPWIYRVAHNTFVNALRSRSRSRIFAMDLDTISPHFLAHHDEDPERDQQYMRQAIEKGLESISVKYREVLILYYLEGLSYKEIADVLRVPVGTVAIRLSRAKAAIKEHLDPRLLP
jgi:RNA polymerase sigma-70 factor (ECF subfamily)